MMRNKMNFRDLVMGVDTKVPLLDGRLITATNFDNSATTPPFKSVMQEIMDFAPWYSSIHRGTGYKSKFSSDIYEQCRRMIGNFVKADMDQNTIIFVKNTTEAINKLAYRLGEKEKKNIILSTCMEHHSNDLPWREKYQVKYVEVDEKGRLSLEDLEHKLRKYGKSVALVTVTGASNVTGYKNDIHRIAVLAHRYHTKILVDGAQLIPHVSMDMKPMDDPEHIDYLAFSGHKMYAPFGIGVLIGPKTCFEAGEPEQVGGGTVDLVTHDFIRWAQVPHKEEAGSPNIIGVVALAAAIRAFKQIGMDRVEEHEQQLMDYGLKRLQAIPNIVFYGDIDQYNDRLGIISFNIEAVPHEVLATILSYEAGIAVRNGCFCAQPYVQRLLGIPEEELRKRIKDPKVYHPGMVRVSFGIYNTTQEVDRLVEVLYRIANYRKYYLEKYKGFSQELR